MREVARCGLVAVLSAAVTAGLLLTASCRADALTTGPATAAALPGVAGAR